MTRSSDFKKVVRRRMAATGRTYMRALHDLRPIVGGAPTRSEQQSATVAMRTEYPMVVIDVNVQGPSGERPATFLVKSGGGSLILAAELARSVGIEVGEATVRENGTEYAHIVQPRIRVGSLELALDGSNPLAVTNFTSLQPGDGPPDINGLLPGRVLRQYCMVFDFAARSVTFGPSGQTLPDADAVPLTVQRETGFPRVVVERDGVSFGLLLDTGLASTLLSRTRLAQLTPTGENYVKGLRLGETELRNLVVLGQNPEHWTGYMSRLTDGAVEGALACDALTGLRLCLDYPSAKLTVTRPSSGDA